MTTDKEKQLYAQIIRDKLPTTAERVRKLIDEKELTLYSLSKQTNIPVSTLSRVCSGQIKKPHLQTLKTLANYFQVPLSVIDSTRAVREDQITIYQTDEPDPRFEAAVKERINQNRKIPFTSEIKNLEDYLKGNFPPSTRRVHAPAFYTQFADMVATRAMGRANHPYIMAGDIIYVRPIMAKDGDYVVGYSDDKETPYLRKYIEGDDEKTRWLQATNPEWEGPRQIPCRRVLGIVLAIERKL